MIGDSAKERAKTGHVVCVPRFDSHVSVVQQPTVQTVTNTNIDGYGTICSNHTEPAVLSGNIADYHSIKFHHFFEKLQSNLSRS